MKYTKQKKVWKYSFANELVRLSQGVGKVVKGTEIIFFVNSKDIPSERCKDIAYGRIVVYYRT